MINTQYINLNMIPSGVMPVLYCSQYDIGRPLGFVVYNGSESVDLSTYTVTIEATRTDGAAITAAVTTSGNIGAFVTTATMTNQADEYSAKLVIVDGSGNRVASLAFLMYVTPKTMDENAEEIAEDESLYHQYTITIQSLIAAIRADLLSKTTALQSRITAEETARINAINAEATARQNAINTEATARQSANTSLQNDLAAERSTRSIADTSLQSQITQLVTPGSDPSVSEVTNARVGADGTTYSTLGDAIRTQNLNIKRAMDDLNGVYVITNWNVGKFIKVSEEPIDRTNLISDSNYRCAVIPCSEGAVFTVTATGGNAARAWTFINSAGTKLAGSNGAGSVTDRELTAPAGTAYLIINDNSQSPSYRGKRPYAEITALQEKFGSFLPINATEYIYAADNDDVNNYMQCGVYRINSDSIATSMQNLPAALTGVIFVIDSFTIGRKIQIFVTNNNTIYTRYYNTNTFTDWMKLKSDTLSRPVEISYHISYGLADTSYVFITLNRKMVDLSFHNCSGDDTKSPCYKSSNPFNFLRGYGNRYFMASNCNFGGFEGDGEIVWGYYWKGDKQYADPDVVERYGRTRPFFAFNSANGNCAWYGDTELDAAVNDGYDVVFGCGNWLMLNGTQNENVVNSAPYDPRTCFGWDDDYYYVLVTEGRGLHEKGMNEYDCQSVFASKGVANAVVWDGGGSTCLAANTPMVTKINGFRDSSGKNVYPLLRPVGLCACFSNK